MTKFEFEIDTESWARWPEILEYAKAREIYVAEALVELANKGLSHLDAD